MAKYKLKSLDNEIFEVDEEVALQSDTVKNMVEDVDQSSANEPIPLPNVSGRILAKVIEYCKYHSDAKKGSTPERTAPTEDDIKAWDQEFVKVDQATLFDLILVSSSCFCVFASDVLLSQCPLSPSFVSLTCELFPLSGLLHVEVVT